MTIWAPTGAEIWRLSPVRRRMPGAFNNEMPTATTGDTAEIPPYPTPRISLYLYSGFVGRLFISAPTDFVNRSTSSKFTPTGPFGGSCRRNEFASRFR